MITARQIAALKYLIFRAKDVNELSKRLLAFLIDRSEGLTKSVCLTLVAEREGFSADQIHAAAFDIDRMKSSNGSTHIDQILHAVGCGLVLSTHYGDFDPSRADDPFNSDGQFAGLDESLVRESGLVRTGMPVRYTFWLAQEYYSREAELVVATSDVLEQINLAKPGLYPSLESKAGY